MLLFRIAGDWTNLGTFTPDQSEVRLVDGCGRTTADLSGGLGFFDLSLVTGSGKSFFLVSGSTTTVTGRLLLAGTTAFHLVLRSTSPGSEAFLDAQGTKNVSIVDVDDVLDGDVIGGAGAAGPALGFALAAGVVAAVL